MYYTVLRTPYTPSSGGRIASLSLQGVSSDGLPRGASKTVRRILGLVAIHPPTIPMHIACMYHLSNLHSKLFILAHEMVDKEPENAVSWYAVGVWYLTAKKWQDARTYFRYVYSCWKKRSLTICQSKSTLMDPRSAPAWLAFAHTFALEGEHDHAVTAYSTCSRLFPGYVLQDEVFWCG